MRRVDPTVVDDVCAEVWTVAWRRLDTIPEEPLPWLLAVARRVVSNERRSQRRLAALRERLGREPVGPQSEPVGVTDSRLRTALGQLRPVDREALLLVAWEGLSHQEAASVLALRPATFSVKFHRARQRLAYALERVDEHEHRTALKAEEVP